MLSHLEQEEPSENLRMQVFMVIHKIQHFLQLYLILWEFPFDWEQVTDWEASCFQWGNKTSGYSPVTHNFTSVTRQLVIFNNGFFKWPSEMLNGLRKRPLVNPTKTPKYSFKFPWSKRARFKEVFTDVLHPFSSASHTGCILDTNLILSLSFCSQFCALVLQY